MPLNTCKFFENRVAQLYTSRKHNTYFPLLPSADMRSRLVECLVCRELEHARPRCVAAHTECLGQVLCAGGGRGVR